MYRRDAGCRRRLRVPPARRGSCLDAGIGRQAAARGARQLARRVHRASPSTINDQSERLLTLRGLMELKFADHAGAAGRGRAGGVDREALRHRRDELRLDLARGAHHAGDRDEPHRRQVEHRRGRRGIRSLQAGCRTAIRCARRSSRWRRGGSASPSNIWSTPTTCRSRWRRAPSPARAGSCPATRWTRTSPACAIRRRASA